MDQYATMTLSGGNLSPTHTDREDGGHVRPELEGNGCQKGSHICATLRESCDRVGEAVL